MHAIQLTQKKSKSVLQLPKSYKFDTRVDYGVGMHIGYEWCWSLQVVNLRTLFLSIGVEDDTIEGHSDWTGQISFTFIYTSHES